MGLQEVEKKKLHLHGMQVEEGQEDVSSEKKAVMIALPPLVKPVKVGRRRHGGDEEEKEEEGEVTTPRGGGCRIPAEAATCPPAPKKPRTTTAVSIIASRRRCKFFRAPADLEAAFVNRVAKAN
ncbi:hypothetical protein ABZP36_031948 [Zizania latifolia]